MVLRLTTFEKMKSNTHNYAQRELEMVVKSSTDPENRPLIEPFIPEILALCDKFGHNGDSGGSAPYVAVALSQAIKKLCLQTPICPITGIDDEWIDVAETYGSSGGKEIVYQNNRCSGLFKNSEGRCWYLDAIIVKTQNDQTYATNCGAICKDGSKIYSRNYIKSFPFTPKTFYIDVIEKEVAKDDFEFYVKDEKQLKRVWKYYNRYD